MAAGMQPSRSFFPPSGPHLVNEGVALALTSPWGGTPTGFQRGFLGVARGWFPGHRVRVTRIEVHGRVQAPRAECARGLLLVVNCLRRNPSQSTRWCRSYGTRRWAPPPRLSNSIVQIINRGGRLWQGALQIFILLLLKSLKCRSYDVYLTIRHDGLGRGRSKKGRKAKPKPPLEFELFAAFPCLGWTFYPPRHPEPQRAQHRLYRHQLLNQKVQECSTLVDQGGSPTFSM